MKFQILIYFCLILFFVYIFTVNMKIIEGNTSDCTNCTLLSILEDIQIDVNNIKGKLNA